jgi:hypothetical protein
MFVQNTAKIVSDYVSLFLNKDLSHPFRRSECYHRRWSWHGSCDLGSHYLWFVSHLYCWLFVRFTSRLLYSFFRFSREYFHVNIPMSIFPWWYKVKVTTLCAPWRNIGYGGLALIVLNLGTRCECVVSFVSMPPYARAIGYGTRRWGCWTFAVLLLFS